MSAMSDEDFATLHLHRECRLPDTAFPTENKQLVLNTTHAPLHCLGLCLLRLPVLSCALSSVSCSYEELIDMGKKQSIPDAHVA
jgi:hypothetical protein